MNSVASYSTSTLSPSGRALLSWNIGNRGLTQRSGSQEWLCSVVKRQRIVRRGRKNPSRKTLAYTFLKDEGKKRVTAANLGASMTLIEDGDIIYIEDETLDDSPQMQPLPPRASKQSTNAKAPRHSFSPSRTPGHKASGVSAGKAAAAPAPA